MTDTIVLGGGISGLTTAYRLAEAGASVKLFEAERRLGGTIGTNRRDGFEIETGPNGVLSSRHESMALIEDLGLGKKLRPAAEIAKHRFLVHDGKLAATPSSPVSALTTPLMSWPGRFRVLAEPFIRAAVASDMTIDEFARRRLGPEIAERFVDPMVSGVYGGDSTKLSLAAAFPKLWALEQRGGLIRGMLGQIRDRRRAGGVGGAQKKSRGGFGHLTSLVGGMQTLTDTLAALLGDAVAAGRRATAIEKTSGGWAVEIEGPDGATESAEARQLVLATPSWAAAELLAPFSSPLQRLLREIPYAAITVVSLGFRQSDVKRRLDGFGFLAASRERRQLLGSLWTSSIFPGTAPPDRVLMRNMVGGWRQPELAALDEEPLLQRVVGEIDDLVGLRAPPVFTDIVRWPKGIPQYHVGHMARLEAIDAELAGWPGLHLTGNAYRGVSINDCVIEGAKTAERVTARQA